MPPQMQVRNRNGIVKIFTRILTFPLPFPNLTGLVISLLPALVVLLALCSYYVDFFKSRTTGFFRNPGEVESFDFIVGKFAD